MKQILIICISSLFCAYLQLYYLIISACIGLLSVISSAIIFTPIRSILQSITLQNIKMLKYQISRNRYKQPTAWNYLQAIIDSCISLILSVLLLHYHEYLVELVLLVGHHAHHWFLSWLFPSFPNYSFLIRHNYPLKMCLVYVYLLFGYLGFSTQLAFTVDLISLLNLPTLLLYKLMTITYTRILRLIFRLMDLINTDDHKWLTCSLNPKLRTPSIRVLSIIALICAIQIILLMVFYYFWLSSLIIGIKISMNILYLCIEVVGSLAKICQIMKGYKTADTKFKTKNYYKLQQVVQLLHNKVTSIAIMSSAMLVQIFKGQNIMNSTTPSNYPTSKFDILHSYRQLSTFYMNRSYEHDQSNSL